MLSVAPGKDTMLHWKVTHLRLFGQHKQDLIGVKKKKKDSELCERDMGEVQRENGKIKSSQRTNKTIY